MLRLVVFAVIFLSSLYGIAQEDVWGFSREFRGVWVTTAYNLDWPSSNSLRVEEQKTEFINLLERIKEANMNAVIVQIRASADAFYQSKYEPWSYWLSGKQGEPTDPFYDPLEFMVEECHKRGIQFHAWFNLLRAVPHTKFFPVAKKHVTTTEPHWFYKSDNSLYFDPGIPEVREYLVKIIADVVHRYDIDGVHLDDYFYPQEIGKNKIRDAKTYKKYKNDFTSISDWRRDNVNQLVESLSDTIKEIKKWVWFGISPVAVWRHDKKDAKGSMTRSAITAYDDLYADSKLWVQNGWVDYIMPQLYAGTGAKEADILTMSDWWKEINKKCELWGGLAYYKTKSSSVSYWRDSLEIVNQIAILRNRTFTGIGLYRAMDFMNSRVDVYNNLCTDAFSKPVFLPSLNLKDSIPPDEVVDLKIRSDSSKIILTWQEPLPASDGDKPSHYLVFRLTSINDNLKVSSDYYLGSTSKTIFEIKSDAEGEGFYFVLSQDRNGNIRPSNSGVFLKF